MYSLYIQNPSNNVWYLADIPTNLKVAITFEEAAMAETKAKCSGTQNIELPRTRQNEKIFGYIATDKVNSRLQYRVYPCALLYDSIPLLEKGSRLIITGANDSTYSVVITAPTSTLYSELEAIDFKDKDRACLGYGYQTEHVHTDSWTLPSSGRGDAYDIAFLLQRLSTYTGRDLSALQNSIKKFDTIREMSAIGMPWEEYFITPERQEDARGLTMHFREIKYTYSSFIIYTDSWTSNFAFLIQLVVDPTVATSLPTHRYELRLECTSSQDWSHIEQTAITIFYVINPHEWKTDIDGNKVATLVVRPTVMDAPVREGGASANTGTALLFTPGDTLRVSLKDNWDGNYTGVRLMFATLLPGAAEENAEAIQYQNKYVAQNIGYKNALEFFKAQLQLNGLIAAVKGDTLITYKYADILANKENARDWTKYVVEFSKEYHDSKLAQKNIVSLKANSVTGTQDNASFEIDDNTLQPQADFLAFNAESAQSRFVMGDEPKAPLYLNPYLYYNNGTYAYFEWLSAAEIVSRYDEYIDALQEYRMVKAKMVIPVTEMLSFDHRVPIYLEQLSRYFYVKKISNWMIEQECTVELMQLTF